MTTLSLSFARGRLGFGAGLPALGDAPNALALLETALDSGITHFDTAPLYLWGAAEPLLGRLAARRRDEMTIVTKAGMAPPSLAARLTARVRHAFHRRATPAATRSGLFQPAQVRASLEASLRALRTDRVEALLLHEIRADQMSDELAGELSDLKQAGKTRALGLATPAAYAAPLLQRYPKLFDIVQVSIEDLAALRPNAAVPVAHSVLGARAARLQAKAASDPSFAHRFAEETGVDPKDRVSVGRLLLRTALATNAMGVTLFSSTNATTIRANAALEPADPAFAQRVSALMSAAQ